MVGSIRHPQRLVSLLRRYWLIRLTRLVRHWEKRPLSQRKRQVLLVFGSLTGVLLVNLIYQFQAVNARKPAAKSLAAVAPTDSIAHHQLYMQVRKNRVKPPIQ